MKILRVHNYYLEPGGEDAVEHAERKLCTDAGCDVVLYTRDNREINDYSPWRKASLAPRAIWAWDTRRELAALIERERPDVAHFTNSFPLISPAAYSTCREAGVAVVQSLHNYRLLCPAATFFRDGANCTECIDHSLLRSVRHQCYRGSLAATATVASTLAIHRRLGTYREQVDAYVAFTEFARKRFSANGLPGERIFVKPNFVDEDPGIRERDEESAEDYALFIGRLSPEKGIETLLDGFSKVAPGMRLKIAGDGPLRAKCAESGRAEMLGWLDRPSLRSVLKRARFLVFPSICDESFGLVVIEAFACGVPVLVASRGGMAELVLDGRTGVHFTPGDSGSLATAISWAWNHPKELEDMGRLGRKEYEQKYTPTRNTEQLLNIYHYAIEHLRNSS